MRLEASAVVGGQLDLLVRRELELGEPAGRPVHDADGLPRRVEKREDGRLRDARKGIEKESSVGRELRRVLAPRGRRDFPESRSVERDAIDRTPPDVLFGRREIDDPAGLVGARYLVHDPLSARDRARIAARRAADEEVRK